MLGFVLNVLIHGLNQRPFYKNFQGFTYCSVFKELCFCCSLFFSSNSFILSYRFRFVKNFFHLFLKFFFEDFQSDERRKRDLNPRAGFPTYTLSRGASSASWVFLLITVANYHLLSLSGELARRRIYYTSSVSFCQQLFSIFFIIFYCMFFLRSVFAENILRSAAAQLIWMGLYSYIM